MSLRVLPAAGPVPARVMPANGMAAARAVLAAKAWAVTVALALALAVSVAVPPPPAAVAPATVRLGLPWPPPLRFNWSGSLPRGLYRLEAAPAAPSPGEMVLACPPPGFSRLALARRYLPRGGCPGGTQPLGKLVLAVAGDRLWIEPGHGALWRNGRRLAGTAAAAVDSAGRPLPRLPPGGRRVAGGEVWLIAPHPRSLDSRVFGPVAADQVLGRLVPVLTEGGDAAAVAAAMAAEIRAAAPPAKTASCGERRPSGAPPGPRPYDEGGRLGSGAEACAAGGGGGGGGS